MSIAVGQRVSRSLTLTAEHVRKFAEISGDHNPLHFDAAFAARTKFGRLVVQGGLTTGLVHALVAMDRRVSRRDQSLRPSPHRRHFADRAAAHRAGLGSATCSRREKRRG